MSVRTKISSLLLGAATTLTLLVTGCSFVPGSQNEELSKECKDIIDESIEAFIQSAKPLTDILDTNATPSLSFPGPRQIGDRCEEQGDDPNLAKSAYYIRLSSKLLTPPENQFGYLLFGSLCQSELPKEEKTLTSEAVQVCRDAIDNAVGSHKSQEELFQDAKNWVENGELPSGVNPVPPTTSSESLSDTNYGFTSDASKVDSYTALYMVEGPGKATVSYVNEFDRIVDKEVTLPWQHAITTDLNYTGITVTSLVEGQLSCALYHDGIEVDKYTSSQGKPVVTCFAYR